MPRVTTKHKCPRCKSTRLDQRLTGARFCKKCGQRWTAKGLLIHSFDRRKLKKGVEVPNEEQLILC